MTSTLRPLRPASRRGMVSYADQVRLAKTMEAGRDAEERLDTVRRISADERRRLEEVVELGDDARRELIEGHASLVLTEARRYADDQRTVVELVQQGNAGLVRAVGTFDWRRGIRFSTYAAGWIRLAITSDLPDLPDPAGPRPDAEVVSMYRARVVSLDRTGPDRQGGRMAERRLDQPARLTEPAIGRSPAPSGPMPWELM